MAERTVKPSVALVAGNDLNRLLLAKLLDEAGYQADLSIKAGQLAAFFAEPSTTRVDQQIDAWLLCADDKAEETALDLIIEHSDKPLLVCDDMPSSRQTEEFQIWRRRLFEKLELIAIPVPETSESVATDTSTAAMNGAQVDQVWVLAASFGGPEAVKKFLTRLPAQLPIAMVYGQHIENNFDQVLRKAVSIDHSYPINVLRGRSHLAKGTVAVVPADKQVRFLARGEVVETRQKWDAPYQPSLDQVIAELARVYRERLGIIVFSGMCNDGEIGCRVASACGSTVWVQTPESCLSPDMPNAALATGSVSFQGTPEELAQALGKFYKTNRRQVSRQARLQPANVTLRPVGQK